MKKSVLLVLVLAITLSLCACGMKNADTDTAGSVTPESSVAPEKSETTATVINNDGITETLTARELIKIHDGNSVAFNKKYFEAEVTVIGTVESVHGTTVLNGHTMSAYIELEGGWRVEASSEDVVIDLLPGDTVKVTGHIYSAFGNVSLYIFNGYETSIQSYN